MLTPAKNVIATIEKITIHDASRSLFSVVTLFGVLPSAMLITSFGV
jgi:hypothetical protein